MRGCSVRSRGSSTTSHDWRGFDSRIMRINAADLKRWEMLQFDAGPTASGLNTKDCPALDGDLDESSEYAPKVAEIWRSAAGGVSGATPAIRRRDGSLRFVLFFKHKDNTAPIVKRRHSVKTPDGKIHTLELLADGQQVIIEGPHAKGRMHYWEGENGGLAEHVGELPQIAVADVDVLFGVLASAAEAAGFEVYRPTPSASDRAAGPTVKIGDV